MSSTLVSVSAEQVVIATNLEDHFAPGGASHDLMPHLEAMRPDTLALRGPRAGRYPGWGQEHAPPSWIAGWGFGTHFVMRPVNAPSV
ncbi:MAG: hypothetical protein ACRCTR_05340 [Actinomycetota bacterium]